MLESRAPHSPGTTFGLVLIAALTLLDVGLLFLLLNEPVSLMSFFWGALLLVSLPAVAFIAYWTSSLSSTRYHVMGDALIIEWGRLSQAIPLKQISSVVRGEAVHQVRRFRGVRWPGCFVGHGLVSSNDGTISDQETVFYATRPLQSQLLLITSFMAYSVSPVDLDNFADCLVALRVPELAGFSDQNRSDLGPFTWHIWQDGWALLTMAAAVLMNGALFAYLSVLYQTLPVTVPLHFDAAGMIDRFGPPTRLFVLPALGLLAWLTNGAVGWLVYQMRGERMVAVVLWGAAILVQLVTWIAVVGLLR